MVVHEISRKGQQRPGLVVGHALEIEQSIQYVKVSTMQSLKQLSARIWEENLKDIHCINSKVNRLF